MESHSTGCRRRLLERADRDLDRAKELERDRWVGVERRPCAVIPLRVLSNWLK
jgi:hypothetical protein